MSLKEAITLYNKATGASVSESSVLLIPHANRAIKSLMAVDELTQRLGGAVCSRQAAAIIIHFSNIIAP